MLNNYSTVIMSLSIAEVAERFKWPTEAVKKLVEIIVKNRAGLEPDWSGCTVGLYDLILELEHKYEELAHQVFQQRYRPIIVRLVKIGLTRLDSIILPAETVTLEMLQAIPRAKFLKMDARILWTVDETYGQRSATDSNDRRLYFPTVAKLLTWPAEPYDLDGKTIGLLEKLGFDFADGLFMQAGSRSRLIDNLMNEENIDRPTAALVASIAIKRGWVKLRCGK